MKIDELGLIITPEPAPGCYGDSCAETSRYIILRRCVDKMILEQRELDLLEHFITHVGYLRHPKSPWREDDTSSDQLVPLVLARALLGSPITGRWSRIPGTKTIVSPGLWFAVRGMWLGLALVNLVQSLLLKIPYRWSDDARVTGLWKLVRDETHTADYLNLAMIHLSLKKMGRWSMVLQSNELMLEKVRAYYQHQPGHEWLTDLYAKALK